MKHILIPIALFLLATGVHAETEGPAMKFTSLPMAHHTGEASVKVTPYRAEDTVMVQIEEPVQCGERPVRPGFEIEGTRLRLHYDLARDSAGTGERDCAARSAFVLSQMPDRDLEVVFARAGIEGTVARMTRCPHSKAVHDLWDCMVPDAEPAAVPQVRAAVAPAEVRPGPSPALKFTELGSVPRVDTGERRISPYRAEDTIVVLVEEPVICGQTARNPAFELREATLALRYALSLAPAHGAGACTLRSAFQLSEMPHRDLDVSFENGTGSFLVGQMTHCGRSPSTKDRWDCLLPGDAKPAQAARAEVRATAPEMKFVALPVNSAPGVPVQRLRPFRNGHTVTAIVEAPIACGQRPQLPSFELAGDRLNLSFELSEAADGAARGCSVLASFQVSGLPARDLQVAFSAGHAAALVSGMEACAHAGASGSPWDCMVPSRN